MAKKKKESSKPSGFQWSRDRNRVTVGWKTHGYDKQKRRVKTATSKKTKPDWSPKKGTSISKSASSYTFSLDASKYYPETSVYLKWLDISVRGTTKDTDKINYTESDWASPGAFIFHAPKPPTVVTHSQASARETIFGVEIGNHVRNKGFWATKVQYQSCLVLDADYAKYDDIPKSAKKNKIGEDDDTYWTIYNSVTGQDTTSFTYDANDTTAIGSAEKAVRWFRARVVGPAGASAWVEDHIAYSESKAVSSTKLVISENNADGYDCTITWSALNSLNNPIETMQIQYTISPPAYNPTTDKLTPASTNWQTAEIGGNNTLTPAMVKKDTSQKTYLMTEHFVIPTLLAKDQMIFARVNTTNNGVTTWGDIVYAMDSNGHIFNATQTLSQPANPILAPLEDNLVRVTFNNSCTISGAFVTVGLVTEKESSVYKSYIPAPTNGYDSPAASQLRKAVSNTGYWATVSETSSTVIGIIQLTGTGDISKTIALPSSLVANETKYNLALQTVVGKSQLSGEKEGATVYSVTTKLSSDYTHLGDLPEPPTILGLDNLLDGNVRITFDWAWDSAKSAEIAWSDYALAMESNDNPNSYILSDTRRNSVVIRGLEPGKTWHFWVRYLSDTQATPWSNVASIGLTSAPNVPSLAATKYYILLDGKDTSTLSWSYVSTDTTDQASATIAQVLPPDSDISVTTKGDGEKTSFDMGAPIETLESVKVNDVATEATFSDNNLIFATAPAEASTIEVVFTSSANYYKPLIKIPNEDQPNGTDQYTILDASDIPEWQVGGEYSLAVKVVSESNLESEWSDTITVAVPEPLTCTIETNLYTDDISDAEPYPKLIALSDDSPFTITVTGYRETTDPVSVYIERAANYFVDRPDGGLYGGYAGETVFAETLYGSGEFTVEQSEIRGYLDDTASYRIVAIIQDKYGQVAPAEQEFVVAWEHQALMPNAQMAVDQENLLAFIKILEPEEGTVADGDVCDIYRASVDGWELVYDGAAFGSTYVDPYPTIGEHGGHRVVYRTFNGDYITPNNGFAWIDFDPEDGDLIQSYRHIIDFGGDRCEVMFNTDLSNTWSKDFQKTKYLGGSIVGDWNAGVDKSGSISTYEITSDISNIEALHRLAEYEGECRIRTTDGSNYVGNVDVSESVPHDPYYDPQGVFTKLASYSLDIERVDSPTRTLIALKDGDIEGFSIGEWFGANPLILDEDHNGGLVLPDGHLLTLVQPEGD